MWASGQVKECTAIAPSLYGLVWPPKRPPCALLVLLGRSGEGAGYTHVLPMLRYVQSPGKDGGRRETWMALEESTRLRQEGGVTQGIA